MNALSHTVLQEMHAAREAFEANETRDLFRLAATEQVNLAVCGDASPNVAKAAAVLVQTWNQA